MLIKVIIVVLIISLFCSISITGYAADNERLTEKSPTNGIKMTYIQSVHTSLSISSGGLSNSYAFITSYSGTDKLRISMYLQRYDNGWKTVKHWVKDFYNTYGSLTKDWYVAHGYEYRVLTYFYAYDGSASESISRVHDGMWY